MKNCGCCNVRKHREIKDGEKFITLEIYLKFGSMYKIKITSSEPKDYLGISGKWLIIYLGLNTIGSSNKNKKSRYSITNVSMKEIHNIIKEFEKLPYEGYVRKRPKHEHTDSYFYLYIYLAKCMIRADTFNSQFDPIIMQMTSMQYIPILQVFCLDESKSKGIITDKNIQQVCSTYKSEKERVIVNESSTDESESKIVHKGINTNKVKYEIDETEDEEPLVTDNQDINEPSYFNLFQCGKKILKNLDSVCERSCMANSKNNYYTEIFNTLTDYNERNNTPLINSNIIKAIRKFMEEESLTDANNVTADTFSHDSSAQRENANAIFTNEKLDKSYELVDAVMNLTIDDAEYYESKTATISDAQGDLTSDP